MGNPFEGLTSKARPHSVDYEEWGGSFTCQTRDCWDVVHVARYVREAKLLTWKCANGHISSTEYDD